MTQMQRAALDYSKPRSRADSGEAAEEAFTYHLSAANNLAAGWKLRSQAARDCKRKNVNCVLKMRGLSLPTAEQLEQAGGAQRHHHSPSRCTVAVAAPQGGRASPREEASKKKSLFLQANEWSDFEPILSLKNP